MLLGSVLAFLSIWLIAFVLLRVIPVVRHGRKVVLDRPKPCSMNEVQHALDRLLAAGFDAEIVEDEDSGTNMWANMAVLTEARPDERYVIQVPRKQAKAANLV